MIDLAWVLTMLFGNLIGNPGIMDSVAENSVFGLFFDFGMWSKGLVMAFVILGTSLGSLAAIMTTITTLAPLIIFIILGIVIMIVAIKIFLMLIRAYVYIILYTIIGPVWIFLGILPGFNALGAWFRAVLSQIVVFPATAILLILANRFMFINWEDLLAILTNWTAGGGEPILPLMGGTTTIQARMYIALGIIFYIPSLVKQLQAMLQKPLGLESAIGMPRWAGGYA